MSELLMSYFLSAWEVTNNCTSMQLAEQQTSTYKMQTKVATNGMYQFCLLLKCNNGKATPFIPTLLVYRASK